MKKYFKLYYILECIILFSIISPILCVCLYAVPSADDFSFALGWKNFNGMQYKYVWNNMVKLYNSWQGTYFANFVAGFPVYDMLGLLGLRIWLIGVALFFFISFLWMLFSFINNLEIPNEKKMLGTLTFGTLGFLYVLCNNDLSEIFFWYTGSFGYTLPLSFVFLSISCYMNYERKERNSTLILGSICAIVAAGGALNITALLCALLLMGILYNKIVCKQVKKNIIIGITALIGAIINVIAPGNYVRHAVIDSKIRPLFSICTTLLRVNHVIAIELQKGFLLFVIVIAFIFAYKNSQHSSVKFRYPVLITLYGYFALIITDFPVILGYSSSANLPGRCTFVESVSTIIFFICVIAYWGGWAAQKNIFQFTAVSFLLIALICSMPLFKYFDIYTLTDLTPYKMVYHIFCGDYKTELERELSIINQIENSTENEVTVCIAKPKDEEWTNLKKIGLSEDSTFWVNDALADYYSKNAIILQYIEQ